MTKAEAIDLFGSVEALRLALGLKTRHAIYMWDEDLPIPERHALKIKHELRPDAFSPAPAPTAKAA